LKGRQGFDTISKLSAGSKNARAEQWYWRPDQTLKHLRSKEMGFWLKEQPCGLADRRITAHGRDGACCHWKKKNE